MSAEVVLELMILMCNDHTNTVPINSNINSYLVFIYSLVFLYFWPHYSYFLYPCLVYQSTVCVCRKSGAFTNRGPRTLDFYRGTYTYSFVLYLFIETFPSCVTSLLSRGTIDIKYTLISGDIYPLAPPVPYCRYFSFRNVVGSFSVRCGVDGFHGYLSFGFLLPFLYQI